MNINRQRLDVLYEDNHLLVVNKPAGIPTMGAESGPTLHSLAADYLKHKYHKPGNVFVGVVSRLDSMTSGVLVLARTSKAASRLAPQFSGKQNGGAVKFYLAAVEGELEQQVSEWKDFVAKDDAAKRMRVVGETVAGAKLARLRFLTLAHGESHSVLAIQLLSGRKHQIRVQAADRGHPVVGDRKYAAQTRFPSGIALHSWRLRVIHPTRRTPMWFDAPLPGSWKSVRQGLPSMETIRDHVEAQFPVAEDDSV